MTNRITLVAIATTALAFAAAAVARAPVPVNPDSGLPYCSARVKDRCIQKSDLKRDKPAAAAAAKAG